MRASVGGSTHKVCLGKWNKWLEFMEKKGRGPWLNLLDKSEVLTLLLEFMAYRLFSFNNQQFTVRGYLATIKFFPQAVPRVGADNFALYDRGSEKRDRHVPGCCAERQNCSRTRMGSCTWISVRRATA